MLGGLRTSQLPRALNGLKVGAQSRRAKVPMRWTLDILMTKTLKDLLARERILPTLPRNGGHAKVPGYPLSGRGGADSQRDLTRCPPDCAEAAM